MNKLHLKENGLEVRRKVLTEEKWLPGVPYTGESQLQVSGISGSHDLPVSGIPGSRDLPVSEIPGSREKFASKKGPGVRDTKE